MEIIYLFENSRTTGLAMAMEMIFILSKNKKAWQCWDNGDGYGWGKGLGYEDENIYTHLDEGDNYGDGSGSRLTYLGNGDATCLADCPGIIRRYTLYDRIVRAMQIVFKKERGFKWELRPRYILTGRIVFKR